MTPEEMIKIAEEKVKGIPNWEICENVAKVVVHWRRTGGGHAPYDSWKEDTKAIKRICVHCRFRLSRTVRLKSNRSGTCDGALFIRRD